jgi:hypothetical protein
MDCGSSKDDEGLPIKIPDQFTVYFVTGQVCMPSNAPAGTPGGTVPKVPVRFDVCVHRCITVQEPRLRAWFGCSGALCSMLLMATAQAYRVKTETGCDGRELPNPPPGSCTQQSFPFNNLDAPLLTSGDFLTGSVMVSVPFMTMEQAENVSKRIEAGEDAQLVVATEVGPPPQTRQFPVDFQPGNTAVADAMQLSGADCHSMPMP